MSRLRPLDGNTRRAVFSRGKPIYPMGSPNHLGVNQHRGVKRMPTPKPVPPYHTRMDAMAKGQALKPQPGKTVSTPMVNAPPADVRPKPTKPVSMTPYMNPPHTGIAKPRPIPVKLPLKPAPSLGDMARRRLAKGK